MSALLAKNSGMLGESLKLKTMHYHAACIAEHPRAGCEVEQEGRAGECRGSAAESRMAGGDRVKKRMEAGFLYKLTSDGRRYMHITPNIDLNFN